MQQLFRSRGRMNHRKISTRSGRTRRRRRFERTKKYWIDPCVVIYLSRNKWRNNLAIDVKNVWMSNQLSIWNPWIFMWISMRTCNLPIFFAIFISMSLEYFAPIIFSSLLKIHGLSNKYFIDNISKYKTAICFIIHFISYILISL